MVHDRQNNFEFLYQCLQEEICIMDDKLKRTIGNQLWECRVKKGWTQAFVSRQLGISIRTISRVENGSGISKTLLKKMCSLYRVSVNELYKQDETIIKNRVSAQIDVIPEDVAVKILCQSSFVGDIQRESILRFNDIIQKDGIMYKEQIEEILSEMISIKQNYSLSDVVYCCMMINQKTLDKIDKIIEDA